MTMHTSLSNYERETVITFNEAEDTAHVFTYNKTWQRHCEKKLGLKPTMDNGYGGREYELPKKRIRPPRPPRPSRTLSEEAKAKLATRLAKARAASKNQKIGTKTLTVQAKLASSTRRVRKP